MAQDLPPGPIIIADWHLCAESKDFFNRILQKKKRRQFGTSITNHSPLYVMWVYWSFIKVYIFTVKWNYV